MNEEIQTLVDSLRRGQYEDPTAKIELLIAALQEHRADDAVLLSLLRSPQIPLRLAAVSACRGRLNGELAPELLKLGEKSQKSLNDLEEKLRSMRLKRWPRTVTPE